VVSAAALLTAGTGKASAGGSAIICETCCDTGGGQVACCSNDGEGCGCPDGWHEFNMCGGGSCWVGEECPGECCDCQEDTPSEFGCDDTCSPCPPNQPPTYMCALNCIHYVGDDQLVSCE
jgi:hypothetical protein